MEERGRRCFEAGALATGAGLTITPESKLYAEFRTDERALAAYRRGDHYARPGAVTSIMPVRRHAERQ